MQSAEELRDMKGQATELLNREAAALQVAIELSQSHAPAGELAAAIRIADVIRSERSTLLRLIGDMESPRPT